MSKFLRNYLQKFLGVKKLWKFFCKYLRKFLGKKKLCKFLHNYLQKILGLKIFAQIFLQIFVQIFGEKNICANICGKICKKISANFLWILPLSIILSDGFLNIKKLILPPMWSSFQMSDHHVLLTSCINRFVRPTQPHVNLKKPFMIWWMW